MAMGRAACEEPRAAASARARQCLGSGGCPRLHARAGRSRPQPGSLACRLPSVLRARRTSASSWRVASVAAEIGRRRSAATRRAAS